jgi:hypothetical protein
VVLDDGGDEAIGFCEVEIHCADNKKARRCSRRASFPKSLGRKIRTRPVAGWHGDDDDAVRRGLS